MFWFLGVLGVIFEFLKFLKMSILIFYNSNYSLFSKLFWFEASLSDFLKFLTFWFLCVLGVIFDFLTFSKMSFLIFFNSNYILFSKLFWFEASLSDFLKILTFWFWGVFGVIFEFLNFLKMPFLIFFNSELRTDVLSVWVSYHRPHQSQELLFSIRCTAPQ